MTVVGWLRHYWYDPRLAYHGSAVFKGSGEFWDSKRDFLKVDPDKIWRPDITLANSVDYNWDELCGHAEAIVTDDSGTTMVATSDQDVPGGPTQGGKPPLRYNVFWSRPCVLKAKCDVALNWYPFDTNVCPLEFTPWTQ